jgi:hypothetical protein
MANEREDRINFWKKEDNPTVGKSLKVGVKTVLGQLGMGGAPAAADMIKERQKKEKKAMGDD